MNILKKFRLSSENVTAIIIFLIAYSMPIFMSPYKVNVFSYFMTNILLTLSVSLIWGLTGIFSFGQAAFFGVGGYAYGIICIASENTKISLLAAIIAIAIAGIIAGILGYFMFYGGINDVFVGLITLCVTIALETFMGQTAGSQWKIAGVKLGGYNGLTNIPTISLGNYKLQSISLYIFMLSIVLIIYLGLRKLQTSKLGYSLLAIRENRSRSELFGYNVSKIQVIVFVIGGCIAGLSGVLYASWGNYITPSNMSLTASTIPVVLVAAGGKKNITAPIIFTALYSYFSHSLSASGNQYALVILGLVLVLVILFVPNGIIVSLFKTIDSFFRRLKREN
ncbi:ABC transporter permease subunit [Clostridium sp. LBM24168]